MRVVVAMSGGVDSSTVAGLLHHAGHEVIGITLQLYDHGAATGAKGTCCAGQDIYDARRVADALGISHYVIDAEALFGLRVIDSFADSYAAGETPVPCLECNQGVKFPQLVRIAQDLGAERVATGHYVRRIDGPDGAELHQAADQKRDQSWFLFATTRDELAMTLFPLGDAPGKGFVRMEAARLGIRVAEKPDSQDICFVPSGRYAEVVTRIRPDAAQRGEIVSTSGDVLAEHGGIAHYTVGQAKRLGQASVVSGQRQVVVAIDPTRRRVVVGPRGTGVRTIALRDVSWIAPEPAGPTRCHVKLRASEEPRPAVVEGSGVTLDVPALAAPGQACVFYQGTRVLGGGLIARPPPASSVG